MNTSWGPSVRGGLVVDVPASGAHNVIRVLTEQESARLRSPALSPADRALQTSLAADATREVHGALARAVLVLAGEPIDGETPDGGRDTPTAALVGTFAGALPPWAQGHLAAFIDGEVRRMLVGGIDLTVVLRAAESEAHRIGEEMGLDRWTDYSLARREAEAAERRERAERGGRRGR